MSPQNDHGESEGHFYKGLFFGVVVGVGLSLFLNSDTGKELVKKARKKIDEELAEEPIPPDYEEVSKKDLTSEAQNPPKSSSPRHFFKRKT